MKRKRLLGAACALVISATAASAQSGGLRILVVDNADKSPVIGAAVTLSNSNKLVATTTILSDVRGEALFPVLRAGSGYMVQIVMDGYAGVRQEAGVSIGVTKDLVIALAPEAIERVTVIAEKTQSHAATKFSAEFIQDLPVPGRFYQNVLALAPGVQDPDGDGNPNVNGARDRDFKAQVSGISNVDPLTGRFLSLVVADSIEEITVITAGAGAEYGRAQGGFAQIIQKQGSNDFEGVFGMIYSSSELDGNGATSIPNSRLPDFYRYQPSFHVSGPIVRDKLWYRLSQEYIRREDPLVLGGGGTVATTGTDWFSTSDQLTWQVSNRNKLSFQFQADPRTVTNVGLSALNPPASTYQQETGGPTYALTWTAPYSPSLLVETVVAYQDAESDVLPMTSGVENDCLPGTFLGQARCFNTLDGRFSGSWNSSSWSQRQRLTVKSDATYYKGRLGGMSHQFKAGLIVENERYYRELLRRPSFFLSTILVVDRRGEESLKTVANVGVSVDPFSTQRAVGTNWGIYGEDVVRPLSNLTITLGVRVEQEHITAPGFVPFDPSEEGARFLANYGHLPEEMRTVGIAQSFIGYEDPWGSLDAVQSQFPGMFLQPTSDFAQQTFWTHQRLPDTIDITNLNVAPRLSVAWDPWNDGKTKLSVLAGRIYDKIFLAVPATESNPVIVSNRWLMDDLFDGAAVGYDPQFLFTNVDRHLETPYVDEYSFAVERELWEESSISLRYLHRDFKDQLQDRDINQVPGDYGRCLLQTATQPRYLIASPGTGMVVDVYTGNLYEDTDPGDGDGRLDDCTGQRERIGEATIGGGTTATGPLRRDGFADFYVQNPAWQSIFQIGNENSATYDAIILEFVRRQYKNWQMEASYTWAQTFGDGEDYNLPLGNDETTLDDEQGYQSYDVRHAFKVNATTITPGGFRLGGAIQWQSGLPYSILESGISNASPPLPYGNLGRIYSVNRTRYPTHQRNDHRNRSYWNVDAKLVKEMALPKGMNLQLTAEIFNLLNMDTYIIHNGDTGSQVNGTNNAFRRFGRQYQVGVRWAF